MNIIKHKRYTILPVVLGVVLSGALAIHSFIHPHPTLATGDAAFSLSPASGDYNVGNSINLVVYETSQSGDNANATQVNLTYSGNLTFNSTSINGPFTLCAQNSHTATTVNLACASSTTESTGQPVVIATISFSVNATGSGLVALASGSDIDSTSGSSVWNGNYPSVDYTLSTPPPPAATGAGSTSGSGSGSNSGGTATSKPSSAAKTTTPVVTPTTTSTSPAATTPAAPTTSRTNVVSLGSLAITIYSSSGQKLVNAKVVMDNSITVYTNSSGIAYFSGVKEGSHELTITANGQKPYTTNVTLSPGQNKLVNFKLSKASSSNGLIVAIIILLVLLVGGGIYPMMQYIKRRRQPKLPEENRPTYPHITPPPTNTISPLPVIAPTTPTPQPMPSQPTATPSAVDSTLPNGNVIRPNTTDQAISPRPIQNPMPESRTIHPLNETSTNKTHL